MPFQGAPAPSRRPPGEWRPASDTPASDRPASDAASSRRLVVVRNRKSEGSGSPALPRPESWLHYPSAGRCAFTTTFMCSSSEYQYSSVSTISLPVFRSAAGMVCIWRTPCADTPSMLWVPRSSCFVNWLRGTLLPAGEANHFGGLRRRRMIHRACQCRFFCCGYR